MVIFEVILVRFFVIVDSQTSFTLCEGVDLGKVGVRKFWKPGVRAGHFTSDTATLLFSTDLKSRLIVRCWKPIKCIVKALLRRCIQHQIVHKMQTVDPTSFNIEVLPDSAVMVCSRGKQHVDLDRPVDRRVSVVRSRLILQWIDKIDKKNIFQSVFQKVHKNEKRCILWHFVLVTLLPTGRSRLIKIFSSRS